MRYLYTFANSPGLVIEKKYHINYIKIVECKRKIDKNNCKKKKLISFPRTNRYND